MHPTGTTTPGSTTADATSADPAGPTSTSTRTSTTAASAGSDRPLATRPDPSDLAMPAVSSGLLMAAYLALRPYGDAASGTSAEAAAAFADPMWVLAHLAGALALVQLGRVALRMHDLVGSLLTQIGRWSGLAGAVLVLPYYGAETFGLHAVGRAGLTDPTVMALVDEIRNQPAALTTFGLGLLLLAVSGVTVALAWRREVRSGRWDAPAWAAWPLAVGAVTVLPQYSLPPAGRVAYGLAFAAAALLLAVSAGRAGRR
ncbi:hypothetical protein GCM10027055_30490 [Janibacter alkaliphilus]|uniref:Uncharacterized protein n=1 Tax=Janibacter alkaliphilus TaxID=1069963 RepID=A0A852XD30_9MICO|nr:hypothetical protein [Janibacter alkaliphilus]NYG36371.1 hypothetical protein [Janibacter alkaliphilus]